MTIAANVLRKLVKELPPNPLPLTVQGLEVSIGSCGNNKSTEFVSGGQLCHREKELAIRKEA